MNSLIDMLASSAPASPEQIDAYITLGAVMAMVLSMAYILAREPVNTTGPAVAFIAVASFTFGILLPEPLIWWMARHRWLDPAVVAGFPRRMWGLLALSCGLAGTGLVKGIIHAAKKRIQKL
jgi:hypothetical protein